MFELPNQPNTIGSTSVSTEGSSDGNPIVVPGVRATQFRHLLLYFYGTITDPAYRSLILDATDESEHSPDAFVRYLHIASLSHRFCFSSIEAWALAQLNRVLQSCNALADEIWTNTDDLLDALAYSKLLADRNTEHNVRSLIRCYIYHLIIDPESGDKYQNDPKHLAQFYKRPRLKEEDSALFGYVFCTVLKAHHTSAPWKHLSRDERSQLLAALVYLTPLPPTLPTNWIYGTVEISKEINTQSREECFDDCAESFLDDFSNNVSCSNLESGLLRVGLVELLDLADVRQVLAKKLRAAECTCAKQLLEVVDLKINDLFAQMAEKYHNCLV
ncbi:hypothetical protein FRC09_011474 [Ceratobasidium sp. 395]|nr:hypothetical protein FRC09_011474 [Ceratobasidium sp. 395]